MERRAHGDLRSARFVWIAAALLLMAGVVSAARWRLLVPAQAGTRVKELAAGKILVARRELLDPNFAETVVLLLQYDEKGTVGLIINRKTKIPISKLAKELEPAKGRTDPLYLGGPVEATGLMALLKSPTKPEDAKRLWKQAQHDADVRFQLYEYFAQRKPEPAPSVEETAQGKKEPMETVVPR